MSDGVKILISKLLWKFMRIFPIDEKKITVSSYYGKALQDNPKYVAEYLLAKNPELKIHSLENKHRKHNDPRIKVVSNNLLSRTYHLSTGKIWIDNCRKLHYISKRQNQYYIQTWHAGLGLKRIEFDVFDQLYPSYTKWMQSDTDSMDLLIADSVFIKNYFKTAFRFNKEILCCGIPRCDIFTDEIKKQNIRQKLLKKYGLGENDKIIMYAPTFRQDLSSEAYDIDFDKLIKDLDYEYHFFIRLHPNVSDMELNINYGKYIINVSGHDDMQELLITSDILITDYSSCMFDFLYLGKRCVLYASDLEKYIASRSLLIDYNKLPFPCTYNYDQLLLTLRKKEDYKSIYEKWALDYGVCKPGNAARQIADWINERL